MSMAQWLFTKAGSRSRRCLPLFFVTGVTVSFVLQLFPLNDGTLAFAATESSANTPSNSSNATTVDVKKYGAVGDGVTNDTAAFIKALAACAVDGGSCLVPEGTYLISPSG